MTQRRPERVAHLIQQVIGDMLLREVRDLRLSRVVITGSKVTADLRLAHVYYTLMGMEEPQGSLGESKDVQEETQRALTLAAPFFRRQIGRLIRLRHTPEIVFQFDETLQVARRLESLLSAIPPPAPENPEEPEGADQ